MTLLNSCCSYYKSMGLTIVVETQILSMKRPHIGFGIETEVEDN